MPSEYQMGQCSALLQKIVRLAIGKACSNEKKGKVILVRVAFALDRESPLRMSYGAIENELSQILVAERTHRA